MEVLGSLYHWSPSSRREAIQKKGLVVSAPKTCNVGRHKHICLSPTPLMAWTLSGEFMEAEEWDLYQVILNETDQVHVLPDYGPRIREVRVGNSIPPNRVRYVGSRINTATEEVEHEAVG